MKSADGSPYSARRSCILPSVLDQVAAVAGGTEAASAELSGDEICHIRHRLYYNSFAGLDLSHKAKMGKLKEKKPARITIACNACRSRKQKCSGQKPVCEQCLEFNRPCNWPEQLRRGPEKGYAEALENRLQLTESILLNLLPHLSDELLSLAIPHRESSQDHGAAYVPFPRLEKRGIETWSQFPLDTSHGIRRWQQACTEPVMGSDEPSPKKRRLQNDSSPNCNVDSVQASTEASRVGGTFTEPLYPQILDVSNSIEGCPTQSPSGPNEESASIQRMSSWNGAPSFEFQRQFLW